MRHSINDSLRSFHRLGSSECNVNVGLLHMGCNGEIGDFCYRGGGLVPCFTRYVEPSPLQTCKFFKPKLYTFTFW